MELTFGQSGSLLIVSQSSQVIEKILARQAGGLLAGLDEQPDFQRDFAARFQGAPFSPGSIAGALLADSAKPPIQTAGQSLLGDAVAGDGAMAALGLTGLTTASIAYRDTPEGLSLQFFIGAPESGRRGLLQVLATEAKDCRAAAVRAGRCGQIQPDSPGPSEKLAAAWKSTLNQLNPTAAQLLNYVLDLAGKSDDEKYDLKSELLAQPGRRHHHLRSGILSDTTLGDLREAPEILLIGSPNPWKLGAAIKTAMGLLVPGGSIKDREFLGRRIYSATLPVSLREAAAAHTILRPAAATSP